MRSPYLTALALLIAASTVFAKTATTSKPSSQPHTSSQPRTTTPAAAPTTPAAAPASEVQLPVDPFTKIDSVLSGAEADDLKAALSEAAKDDGVVKANKVYTDSLAKYQNSTAGMKSSNLDSLKGSVKALFAAEKAVILKGNAKLAAAVDKVEKAK